MTSLVRSAVLLGAGALIAKLLVTGQIRYYLSPTFDGLTAATGVVLIGMGVVELWRAVCRARWVQAEHGGLDTTLTLALVAMPVLAGLLLSPRALGAGGLDGTPVSRLVLAFDGSPLDSTSPRLAPRRPIADVPGLMAYLREAGEAGVGQPVHVLGLVAHSDDLPPNEFVLVRYAIVHCVADAQPLGLLVVTPGEFNLRGDQWVEVEGTLSSHPRGADRLVGIHATRVVPTEEPNDPYILAI
jgi:uncharacterized repeat protein (TIGR03943 family)